MAYWSSNLLQLAQALKPVAEEAADTSFMSPWMMGLLVVGMVLAPFSLGTLISKWLKMKDLGMKIGVVLLTLELGLAPFVAQYVIGAVEQSRYRTRHAEWEAKEESRRWR